MTPLLSAHRHCYWLVPLLCWVAVQACSSKPDRSPSIGFAAEGGSRATAGKGATAQAGRESAVGGALDAAGTSGGGSTGGDAGAVALGGESGSAGSGAESGAAGSWNAEGGQPTAGTTQDGATPICGAAQVWVDGAALAISTPAADRFGSITPDELSVAWATSSSGVVTVRYADRTTNQAAFDAPRSLVGAFALDRAAFSSDGLRLVVVNADRRGFTEFTRASRDDALGAPGIGPFAAFEDYAQHTMAAGNSFADVLLDPDDKVLLYSEYGSGVVDTVHRTRRLFSGDPWSVGLPLVAAELQSSGAQTRRPTGMSADGRTLFFWDGLLGIERAGFFDFPRDSFASVRDLGQLIDAQPNADCTRLYHSGPGVSSLDLFVATAH